MQTKSAFLLMLALGCGLVASIGITKVMAKRNAVSAGNPAEMDAIFVAMQDIPMGEPITAQMVKLEDWPKGKIPAGAMGKIEDIEGRRTKAKIYQSSPILENVLLGQGMSEEGASGQIPKGYRVVSVRVDNVVSGGNMIRPSDRVDVLVHLTRNAAKEISETTTRTILQDVKVFAVNDFYDLNSADNSDKLVAQTISLLVPLDQAEKVILADEMGEIRLVMRGTQDDEEVVTGGARVNELFGPTDSADRDKESLLTGPLPANNSSQNSEFLQFLNAHQTGSSVAPLSPPSESWTMRTIAGSEVNEVVLQMEDEGGTAKSDGSGFSLGKVLSSSIRAAKSGMAAPQSQVVSTGADPPEAAPDADEGKKAVVEETD